MHEDELPETSGIFNYVYQEQLPEALIDRAVQTIDAILEHQSQHSNELVNRVIAYVNRNLHDSSLSLKKIASDHVFVSVDYLSRLFVQETGERFSHYLNKLRVETAKQLLLQDSSRIYQVAERVGLGHNPRYFSQVFKKYTGCTPSEFITV